MGIIYFILITLFSLLSTAGVIYLIVYLARNKKQKINLGVNTLLHIYLYVISFVTLAIAAVGAVIFINATASYKVGIPFSYQLEMPFAEEKEILLEMSDTPAEPSCYQGELMKIEGEEVCFDITKQKKGLVNGTTLTISMIILFAIHRITLLFLEKKNTIQWLKKIYNFVSLITYSVLSIVSIPFSIYLLINYIYFRPEEVVRIEAPGSMVALAIVSIPLWIAFLISTLKLRKKEEQ